MRALSTWESLKETPYLGGIIRSNISTADTILSGFSETAAIASDLYRYAMGDNRSVITGEFGATSGLGSSLQSRGFAVTVEIKAESRAESRGQTR